MGWPITKLGDITDVITKGTTPTSVGFKFIESGINFVKVESITSNGQFLPNKFAAISDKCNESLKRSQLKEGDVLFSIAGALGRTALVTKEILPANTNQALAIIRLKSDAKIDMRFLLLALMTGVTIDQIEKHRGGVAQQNLSLGQLKSFEIPLPPIPEQKRIVAILDQAFADIEQARAKTEQNLKNARELFESHLQQVFSQRGEGWVEYGKPLAELCELIVDCEHKTAPIQDEGIPSIRTPNIGKGKLLLDGVRRVSDETYRDWTRRAEPQPGDLILAREAPAGNVAVIPDNLKVCLGQRTVLIRPSTKIFHPEFLTWILLQPSMQQQLLAHSRGATVQHVNMKDIRALSIGEIPSLLVQQKVISFINNAQKETKQLETIYQQKLNALTELKKSILQKAFTGELTRTDKATESKGAAA